MPFRTYDRFDELEELRANRSELQKFHVAKVTFYALWMRLLALTMIMDLSHLSVESNVGYLIAVSKAVRHEIFKLYSDDSPELQSIVSLQVE